MKKKKQYKRYTGEVQIASVSGNPGHEAKQIETRSPLAQSRLKRRTGGWREPGPAVHVANVSGTKRNSSLRVKVKGKAQFGDDMG